MPAPSPSPGTAPRIRAVGRALPPYYADQETLIAIFRDLWAGAQCHATSCQKDGKARCEAVSKQCEATSRKSTVDAVKADKKAACARALLKENCGAAKPPECEGLL